MIGDYLYHDRHRMTWLRNSRDPVTDSCHEALRGRAEKRRTVFPFKQFPHPIDTPIHSNESLTPRQSTQVLG